MNPAKWLLIKELIEMIISIIERVKQYKQGDKK